MTRAGIGTQLSAQGSFNRQGQDYSKAARSRIGGAGDYLTDSTSESLTARKVITDFGQTAARLRALSKDLQAASTDKLWTEIQLAAQIKSALLTALKSRSLLAVQQENLQAFKAHLEQVKGFVEVGSRPPYDVTKAEVDVANANVSLIGSESNLRNALSQLRKVVGFNGEMAVGKPSTASLPDALPLDVGSLMDEAQGRPDLQSARIQIEASRARVESARNGRKPTLSSSANYSWNGTTTPLDRGWAFGLSLNAPIFDGKATDFSVRQAKGNVQVSEARHDQLILALRNDIETAVTGIIDSRKRFEATTVLLQQASETLNLAEGRYEAGVGSAIELSDARNSYAGAQGSHYAAYFDTLIALANLDRVLGRFPPEIKGWIAGGTE
ncbi:hypothetical protein AUK22_06455 [bacterium CG2_30_54_10]|nr:MAG: hypothetical protein AUK22_06455 [bacterium CG2_30_54_10]